MIVFWLGDVIDEWYTCFIAEKAKANEKNWYLGVNRIFDVIASLHTSANSIIIWFSMISPIVYFCCKTVDFNLIMSLWLKSVNVSVMSWFTCFNEWVTANRNQTFSCFWVRIWQIFHLIFISVWVPQRGLGEFVCLQCLHFINHYGWCHIPVFSWIWENEARLAFFFLLFELTLAAFSVEMSSFREQLQRNVSNDLTANCLGCLLSSLQDFVDHVFL